MLMNEDNEVNVGGRSNIPLFEPSFLETSLPMENRSHCNKVVAAMQGSKVVTSKL
jgi:hypothetical protein